MTKFIAIVYGIGEGCDYTIGCNLNVYDLSDPRYRDIKKMESWDDLKECKESLLKYLGDIRYDGEISDDRRVDRIEFVEVSEKKVMEVKEELKNLYKEQRIKKRREKERREYERLKQKFED